MRICIIIFTFISFHNFLFSQNVEPIGSGLTLRGTIHDMVEDKINNKTYVVGYFTSIDGIKMEKVGVVENNLWSSIPDTSKIEGVVLCAEVIEGDLYIGGNFTIGTNEKIVNLAKLVNGTWHSVGIEFMSGSVRDISGFNGEIYVAGDFRAINGILHKGIMKYSNQEWQDAGLNSLLNSQGLYVSGDTLYSWGNGFGNSGNESHTVSYYTDNKWTTLPNFTAEPSVSSSFLIYQGEIYSTNANQLYRYDFISNTWNLITTVSGKKGEKAILFEYNNSIHLVLDDHFYKFTNGEFELMSFQTANDYYFEDINIVKSVNNKLLVGGYYLHWESKSASLTQILNDEIFSFGKVSSDIAHISYNDYSIGNSIVSYNNKYVIGGRFSFADDIYSPNIVYWDGENFTAFDAPLPHNVRQLEIFENELYVVLSNPYNGYKLLKFDGSKWIGIDVPVDFVKINIINDKLFVLDRFEYQLSDGGPYYYQNNSWKELKPYTGPGVDPSFYYGNIQSYKEGYIMTINDWTQSKQIVYLQSDLSDWEILDTIDIFFDDLLTIDDNIFLFRKFRDIIYQYKDGKTDTIAIDIETDEPFFFKIDNRLFYSAFNGSLYRLDSQFKFELYNDLRVRDIQKIDDEKYLLALQSGGYLKGIELVELNNLGILSYLPLNATVEQDKYILCLKNYVQFWPKTDQLNLNFQWVFEGGIPSESDDVYPMVKYDNPGIYNVSFMVTNLDGDSLHQSTEVIVEDCSISTFRENNHDNHWIMGYEFWTGRGLGGFDFTFPDTILASRYMSDFDLHSGSTVMSDKDGNLQFYTNGISLLNMDNEPILGSECLNSGLIDYLPEYFVVNQSVFSLPAVDNDSIYYLFDLDYLSEYYWGVASNLSITTVNMNRNNGKGEVVNCNQIVIDDILMNSTMQACKHRNGKDWWIIVGKYESDEYYKILFTENGIESVETATWTNYYSSPFSGQSTFSPNGEYFAQVIQENQEVSIWKFDNQTGLMSDKQTYTIVPIDEYEYPQGCSFSPDSRFLYVSSLTQLRQIDLCNYEELDVEFIDTWDGTFEFIYPLFFGKQMLTPNQKIVVAPTGSGHFSFGLIESPNEKGIECNFRQHSLQISEHCRNIADVLPVFPHYRNYPSYEGECGGVNTVSHEKDNSFFVYPNPVGTSTLLRFSQRTSGDLYNLNGQKIFSFFNSDYLDTYSLLPGIYFIKTEFGTQKFVKQ